MFLSSVDSRAPSGHVLTVTHTEFHTHIKQRAVCTFSDTSWEHKTFWTEWCSRWTYMLLLNVNFWVVSQLLATTQCHSRHLFSLPWEPQVSPTFVLNRFGRFQNSAVSVVHHTWCKVSQSVRSWFRLAVTHYWPHTVTRRRLPPCTQANCTTSSSKLQSWTSSSPTERWQSLRRSEISLPFMDPGVSEDLAAWL
jgi:hypothetical protein